MAIGEILARVISALFGIAVFVGLIRLMAWRTSFRWRILAPSYARPWYPPKAKRMFQSGVIHGAGIAFNSYKGFLTIGVHETGVSLKPMWPFSAFHAPLFIPYADIRGWKQDWYINVKSVELEFLRAPDVKFVMPASQVRWIAETSGAGLAVSDKRSADRSSLGGWRWLMIINGAFGLLLIAFLAVSGNIFVDFDYRDAMREQFQLPPDARFSSSTTSASRQPCTASMRYGGVVEFSPEAWRDFERRIDAGSIADLVPLEHFSADRRDYETAAGALAWRNLPAPAGLGGAGAAAPQSAVGVTAGKYFCYSLRKRAVDGPGDQFIYRAIPCAEAAPAAPGEVVIDSFHAPGTTVGATVFGIADADNRRLHIEMSLAGWPAYCKPPLIRDIYRETTVIRTTGPEIRS